MSIYPAKAAQEMSKFLADGFDLRSSLEGEQKAQYLVHPQCREAFTPTARQLHMHWVTSYHMDAPTDLVSRFALCRHCGKAIR